MSTAKNRLSNIASHLITPTHAEVAPQPAEFEHRLNYHTLSPTFFLPRAASIEPNVFLKLYCFHCSRILYVKLTRVTLAVQAEAIYHVTANKKPIRRTYAEFADRAKGFAYYLKKHGYKRVGILCTNTPGFLEAFYGAGGAGSVSIGRYCGGLGIDIKVLTVYRD